MSGYIEQTDYDFYVTAIGHVNERKPDPAWRFDRLANPDYYIMAYCLEGEAAYRIDGKELLVGKGDLLLFPKGLARSAASNPENPWSFYSVAFDVRFPDERVREQFEKLDIVTRGPHHYKLPPLFAELNRIWTGKRSGYRVKCRSLLMDALYHIITEQERIAYGTERYYAIERAVDVILSRYREAFTIEELARQSGLSSSHFRLLFKKMTGMTAIQYHHRIRINKAKDLLMSGECNVTEAALSVGFQDIYYFSRLFKKLTGAAPSDYIP